MCVFVRKDFSFNTLPPWQDNEIKPWFATLKVYGMKPVEKFIMVKF